MTLDQYNPPTPSSGFASANPALARAAQASGEEAAEASPAGCAAGAQPSITAPANCIRVWRHGVDSLYLSFQGAIDPKLAVWLQECKVKAQASNEHVVSLAGVQLGDHRFMVLPRGRGRFAFVLEDNWFSIQLSNASAGVLPLALVQIRSEYLTAVGPDEAVRTLVALVDGMGVVQGPPKISRVDLFADFCADLDVAAMPGSHWIKRSKKLSIHEECNEVTGISFGSGNEVSARLYDKTREIRKSRKRYMEPLWTEAGWDGQAQVWRMEFQVRREGLPEAMCGPAGDALQLCGNLWRYLCDEWLRLAVPSESDETRSRWPTHPLWHGLTRVWDELPDAAPLTRVPRARLPSDDQLFRAGISGLTSFMAREGIADVGHGLGEFLHALERYYADPQRRFPEGLQDYASRKAKSKARRYNLPVGVHEEP